MQSCLGIFSSVLICCIGLLHPAHAGGRHAWARRLAAVPPSRDTVREYRLNCGSTEDVQDDSGLTWVPGDRFLTAGSVTAVRTQAPMNFTRSQPVLLSSALVGGVNDVMTFAFEFPFPSPLNSVPYRPFIRLHFAAITSPGFKPQEALFSVAAGGVQLLVNFSVAAAAGQFNVEVFEEYIVPVRGSVLDLTLTPTTGSFAFINALEVFWNRDADTAYLNQTINPKMQDVTVANALQTMYRINCGAHLVDSFGPLAPAGDRLGRFWDSDLGPHPTLYRRIPVLTKLYNQATIMKADIPPDFIPALVDKSVRHQLPEDAKGYQVNLTYMLPVEPSWSYLVRLHFCELEFATRWQRVMNIYINDVLMEEDVDIFWRYGAETACYMDFVVALPLNVSIIKVSVEASRAANNTRKLGLELAALEALKVGNASLASRTQGTGGGPPLLLLPPPSPPLLRSGGGSGPGYRSPSPPGKTEKDDKDDTKKGAAPLILGMALGSGFALLVAITAIVLFCRHWRQWKKEKQQQEAATKEAGSSDLAKAKPVSRTDHKPSMTRSVSVNSHTRTAISSELRSGSLASDTAHIQQSNGLGRRFSLDEVLLMCNNFDEQQLLGMGGFGRVYKGEMLDESKAPVAVKRANQRSSQGVHEFRTEIELLSRLRHRHLVSLIGYCEDEGEMVLVYDYMGQGPLRSHLYGSREAPVLTWRSRLEICIGAARGLHYLHTGSDHCIIHRDVKSTNILLDDQFLAKVSDFGLSKCNFNAEETHVSTAVKGSFGYLDPEYYRRQQLTEKSDVYSFGVVLLEVICARPVICPHLPREEINIVEWALSYQSRGALNEIVDTRMQGMWSTESLNKAGELAAKCLCEEGAERPSMNDVLWNLELALTLQDASVSVIFDNPRQPASRTSSRFTDTESEYSSFGLSLGSNADHSGNGRGEDQSVFSQLSFPEGR